jgi:hypothetical protein
MCSGASDSRYIVDVRLGKLLVPLVSEARLARHVVGRIGAMMTSAFGFFGDQS